MRFLFLVGLLLCFVSLGQCRAPSASAALFSSIPDYKGYTFERFESEYAKKYSSPASREGHKRTFYQNLAKIEAHNAGTRGGLHGHFLKINAYADLSEDVIVKKFTGRSRRIAAGRRLRSAVQYESRLGDGALPASVDWRNSGAVTAVKDQGSCGSCWAHSAVESIESAFYLATKKLTVLSPQHMLECTPNPRHCGGTGGCEGATAELGFEWAKSGIATVESVPYKGQDATCPTNVPLAVKVGGWVKLPENNASALIEAVATVGPISVSVDASSWSFYGGGVFSGCNQNDPVINHAVQLVGYGTDESGNDYWLVRNSWSAGWGENGYIRLLRPKTEQCAMDTKPGDGSACEGETDPIKVCGTCGVLSDSSYPTGVTTA